MEKINKYLSSITGIYGIQWFLDYKFIADVPSLIWMDAPGGERNRIKVEL
jgi:hypothetical protein